MGRLKVWNADAAEWQYAGGGSQPVAVIGPITVTAAEVIAGWDTDHGDVTTDYTLPAGAIVYDMVYRVVTGFDSDANANSMFPFVGGSGSEEFFADPNNSDPLIGVDEQETGTLIGHAPSSNWGGASISPHHVLADIITDNNGGMPVFVKTATPLRFRYGYTGFIGSQPTVGEVEWFLILLTPTAP